MKKKITVLTLCAMLLALCGSIDAQQAGKVLRIGLLDNSTASGSADLWEAFRQEMRKLGWIEGKNITIEYGLPSKSLRACLNLRRSWFV
jgi:putative ABC transport system substrate-binding protein